MPLLILINMMAIQNDVAVLVLPLLTRKKAKPGKEFQYFSSFISVVGETKPNPRSPFNFALCIVFLQGKLTTLFSE
jgi:hypothetical protein